jgi:Conjugative transposon protein TcpC
MVRRSTVDRGPQPDVHDAGFDPGAGDLARDRETRRHSTATWRGAGGRWLVWMFRVVVWAVLLIIGYRGVTAIVFNETPASSQPAAPPSKVAGFPAAAAESYAMAFGQVYLNASAASAAVRGQELAQFLPPGTDTALGYNGQGSVTLQSEQVAGIRARDSHHGVVTLLVRVNGALMELGVPVYANDGRLVISGEPALLPAPARAVLPSTQPPVTDPNATQALTGQLSDFFQAYAGGNADTLARFTVPGTAITGLAGNVTFVELSGVTVPPGGNTRHILATVVWRLPLPAAGDHKAVASPPAEFTMSYALTVTKSSGTWYVKSIGPASHPAGTP